jgi:hypothetical protein
MALCADRPTDRLPVLRGKWLADWPLQPMSGARIVVH